MGWFLQVEASTPEDRTYREELLFAGVQLSGLKSGRSGSLGLHHQPNARFLQLGCCPRPPGCGMRPPNSRRRPVACDIKAWCCRGCGSTGRRACREWIRSSSRTSSTSGTCSPTIWIAWCASPPPVCNAWQGHLHCLLSITPPPLAQASAGAQAGRWQAHIERCNTQGITPSWEDLSHAWECLLWPWFPCL